MSYKYAYSISGNLNIFQNNLSSLQTNMYVNSISGKLLNNYAKNSDLTPYALDTDVTPLQTNIYKYVY